MHEAGVRPNVRTYTALVTALGNAHQWDRAFATVHQMRASRGVEPNAYTYSALLKSLGEQGQWERADALFSELEREALEQYGAPQPGPLPASLATFSQATAAFPSPQVGYLHRHTYMQWDCLAQ